MAYFVSLNHWKVFDIVERRFSHQSCVSKFDVIRYVSYNSDEWQVIELLYGE